jgi:hypothetical protein
VLRLITLTQGGAISAAHPLLVGHISIINQAIANLRLPPDQHHPPRLDASSPEYRAAAQPQPAKKDDSTPRLIDQSQMASEYKLARPARLPIRD